MSMTPITPGESVNYYCANCDIQFGAVPDAEGKIRCPLCKKSIDEKSEGVVQLDHVTYRCCRCNLKFGAVPKDGEPVKCPVCPTDQAGKGG